MSLKNFFDKNYKQIVDIKDFSVLIDNKPFLNYVVKIKHKLYEKMLEILSNNNYTTENLLYY